tara:strand:+ start:19585 stop:19917 length:333 start_codon:yes stop_codon:yes gene_type:complete
MNSNKPFKVRYIPKLNIIIPAQNVNRCLGKLFAIHRPIITPNKLVTTRAIPAPIKIMKGLPDCADSIKVAICVLSPNSARKIVLKDVIKTLKKPDESFDSLSISFESDLG